MSVSKLIDEAIRILGQGVHETKPDASKHEAHILKLDINKADAMLGWKPKLSFRENLEMTFAWYKNYYEKSQDVVEFTDNQIRGFFKSESK